MNRFSNIFRLFFLLMSLAAVLPAHPATFVTATVTVTNAPTVNGNAITLNGTARTFTNAPAINPAIYISTNASIGGSATNLFKQLAAYRLSGTSQVKMSGTNAVVITGGQDEALTATISAGWGRVVLSTNTSTDTFPVRVPAANTAAATNILDLLVIDLGDKPTAVLSAGAPAFANYVDKITTATIDGAKTFRGITVISNNLDVFTLGRVDAANLTNIPRADITNLYAKGTVYVTGNVEVTNSTPAQKFYDTTGGADQKRTIVHADSDGFYIEFSKDDGSASTFPMIINRDGTYGNNGIDLFADLQLDTGRIKSSALTNCVLTNCVAGFTSGVLTGVTVTNSTLSGTVGTLSGGVWTGGGATNLTTTNTTHTATNTWTGDLSFTRANNTALANGDNAAVDLGTKVVVKLKAGPTGPFAICGIAGGLNGRLYWIYNSTGQNMTIKNDSGGDPTPANRIYTNTGADLLITGNGAVCVWYDTEDSRWVVLAVQQ